MDIGILVPVIGISIPVVAILARTANKAIALREKQLEFASREAAERAARYAAQTDRLEDRVRVLERIAVDRGVDISAEIERLRDTPVN